MEGRLEELRLACTARTHARFIAGDRTPSGFVRVVCRDNHCADVQEAKRMGKRCIHVFDLTSGDYWTEFTEAHNGRNSSLQP